ncbi:MAG: 2-amino-4-hydroxy-6-hydroxymethyldihydropteridine diphosphokinase [Deltaproteobacteria bacterium]|nr:2-amino-4-hydroxy-6-hydroxymethyldihydropteridine diphosphokinase [Deltaproteobacteria bacterium]MBW1965930.1 2-amino-4-hydroxy-6-hydroxymethyldihydropteridine diphosphokinase [Deltaproteobacteria bacterium]MCW7074003.1 2-amino-4-hydroxy-6-hydroxymethyldihydropteridine diphosphokinase [Methanophagales archaeon]PXF55888.1 MAG: 2-amino-4-hydroxy-6-hydroxymethyldihydropteridine diphosphokinase [Deltaproteobacteria bacterium]
MKQADFLHWKRTYIGLGANLGNRIENCIKALGLLSGHPEIEVLRCSRWYETEPVEIDTSRWFINAVAEMITALGPEDLLANLLAIEKALGRDRQKTGDRPIDLDLLFMEGVFMRTFNHQIQVPHPRLSGRRFVLIPWAELAPDLFLAPWNRTVSELLAGLPEDGPKVRKLNRKETRKG